MGFACICDKASKNLHVRCIDMTWWKVRFIRGNGQMPYKTFSMQYEVTQHLQIYGRWVLFSSVSSLLSKFLSSNWCVMCFQVITYQIKTFHIMATGTWSGIPPFGHVHCSSKGLPFSVLIIINKCCSVLYWAFWMCLIQFLPAVIWTSYWTW